MLDYSVLVKRYEMLDLLEGHGLCNEVHLNFAALLEHALGAGGGAGVHVDLHVGGLLKQAVDRSHKAAQKQSRVIQVNEDETVSRILADGTSN